jgi:hypothetical protein
MYESDLRDPGRTSAHADIDHVKRYFETCGFDGDSRGLLFCSFCNVQAALQV